jgi:hypothetical protein
VPVAVGFLVAGAAKQLHALKQLLARKQVSGKLSNTAGGSNLCSHNSLTCKLPLMAHLMFSAVLRDCLLIQMLRNIVLQMADRRKLNSTASNGRKLTQGLMGNKHCAKC